MKRVFVIEWPDECGPMWMKFRLQTASAVEIKMTDVTEYVQGVLKDDVEGHARRKLRPIF